MHEYSIVQALLERVEAEATAHRASSVQRIRLRIGELSGVEVDLLRSAFEMFCDRTICAGAELEIEAVQAQWACPRCELSIGSGDILSCPACSLPARLSEGDEILLERIEMEVP